MFFSRSKKSVVNREKISEWELSYWGSSRSEPLIQLNMEHVQFSRSDASHTCMSHDSEGCWDTVLHLITWASSTASSIWARSLRPFITLNCSHRQPLCCNNPPMLGLSYSSLPQLNATLVIWALGEIWRIVLERASRLKSLGLFYIKAGSVRTQQGRANAVINHSVHRPSADATLSAFTCDLTTVFHTSTPWWIRSGLHFWRTKGHQDDLVVTLSVHLCLFYVLLYWSGFISRRRDLLSYMQTYICALLFPKRFF